MPSESTSDTILDEISEFFSKIIWDNNAIDKVLSLSPRIIQVEEYSDLYGLINRLFRDSYSLSIKLHEDYKLSPYKKSLTIIGDKKISDFTLETIYKFISTSTGQLEFYGTLDFSDMIDINTANSLNLFFTNNTPVKLHLALNEDNSKLYKKNYLISEILLLIKSIDVNFTFYDTGNFNSMDIFLLEDKFVIFYFELQDGTKIASYTEDMAVILAAQNNLKSIFQNSKHDTDLISNEDFEIKIFEYIASNSHKVLLTVTFLFGFGLTSKNIDYIKKNNLVSKEKLNSIIKYLEVVKHISSNCEINHVIFKERLSSIVKYNKLNLLDEIIYLDDENMIDYLENLAKIYESSPNQKTYLIKESLPLDSSGISSALIISDSCSLIKRDKYFARKNNSLYYELLNKERNTALLDGFLNLLNSSHYFNKDDDAMVNLIREELIPLVQSRKFLNER